MPENIYIQEPDNQIDIVTLDIPVYNPDTDSICKTPQILGWAIEGSINLLVGADLLLEGVEIILNTGETSIVNDGLAIFELESPLYFGQEIWAEINTENCKSRSCSVYASRIANICLLDSNEQIPGSLTGRLICVEKDLYAQVYDGDGGVYAGILKQEDCIICGGTLPNCLEPPSEETTFYNIISCNDGLIYQTTTILSLANQRVRDSLGVLYRWNNSTTTVATAFKGIVEVLDGEVNCPTIETPCIDYFISGADFGPGTYHAFYYTNCNGASLEGRMFSPNTCMKVKSRTTPTFTSGTNAYLTSGPCS